MNKQEKEELITFVNRAKEDLNFSFGICQKTYHGYVQGNKLINYIEHLYKPQKVKVPELPSKIAKYLEWAKEEKFDFTEDYNMISWEDLRKFGGDDTEYLQMWFFDNDQKENERRHILFLQAYTDGYEVEEEPKWKIINDDKYCLTSIEAGYGNSLHWAFDSTKKKPILFDNEETAMYTAYITGGTVEKV